MPIEVNPPPIPKYPKEIANDREARQYFDQINRIILQLRERTGGDSDAVDQANTSLDVKLSAQIQQLKKEIDGLPEFTMDTSGFTMDSAEFSMDKVIA